MFLKIKVAGENGEWKLFDCREKEIWWNTTRQQLPTSYLKEEMISDEKKQFLNYNGDEDMFAIPIKIPQFDEEIYVNTQAYVLNNNGETVETLIRQFKK